MWCVVVRDSAMLATCNDVWRCDKSSRGVTSLTPVLPDILNVIVTLCYKVKPGEFVGLMKCVWHYKALMFLYFLCVLHKM